MHIRYHWLNWIKIETVYGINKIKKEPKMCLYVSDSEAYYVKLPCVEIKLC
jgi:hypothetical protein